MFQSEHRQRVSGGSVELWRDALALAKTNRRELVTTSVCTLGVVVILSVLPGIPGYLRGLFTGVILVFLAWMVSWRIWVTSGLSLRLNGTWAEQAIASDLRGSPHVLHLVRSFKLDHRDIDAIAITRQHVLVVEVKWSLNSSWARTVDGAAVQTARACRSLRHQVRVDGLSPDLFLPVVIYCGREAAHLEPTRHPVQVGPIESVVVMGATHLEGWLADQSGGHISQEFASIITENIETLAEIRESANVDSSWMIRRLARAK
jgi:hypothetical protein